MFRDIKKKKKKRRKRKKSFFFISKLEFIASGNTGTQAKMGLGAKKDESGRSPIQNGFAPSGA